MKKTGVAAVAYSSQSESFKRLNPHLFGVTQPSPVSEAAPKERRIRQSHEPELNKLEAEWVAYLKAVGRVDHMRTQSLRFRLGNGVWYKPDVTGFDGNTGRLTAWEVKGTHAFRGGFENLKVAAGLWPEWRWLLVWKDAGQWKLQEVRP